MKLAEMGSWVGSREEGLWVREIRKLTDSGHQTSLIATAFNQLGLQNAAALFSRWSIPLGLDRPAMPIDQDQAHPASGALCSASAPSESRRNGHQKMGEAESQSARTDRTPGA
jgi:hypothetical protein